MAVVHCQNAASALAAKASAFFVFAHFCLHSLAASSFNLSAAAWPRFLATISK
jgi:hypothetical protein